MQGIGAYICTRCDILHLRTASVSTSSYKRVLPRKHRFFFFTPLIQGIVQLLCSRCNRPVEELFLGSSANAISGSDMQSFQLAWLQRSRCFAKR